MRERDEDLLQRALDGSVEDAEAARLRSRLASDPRLRARAEQLGRLADLLKDQEAVEPPAALTDRVMEAVMAAAAAGEDAPRRRGLRDQLFGLLLHHSRQDEKRSESPWMTGWAGGGAIVAKKALWAVAGVALIVILAVVYYNGTRSVSGGAEGTIGAADRYRGAQPTSKDVVASQGAAQQFLQSDVFDRIVKDKNVRNLLADRDMCNLLAAVPEDALQGDSEAWVELRKTRTALADNPEMLEALRSVRARNAIAEMEVSEALKRAAIHAALADPQLMADLRKARLAFAGSDDQWAAALKGNNAVALAGSEQEGLAALRKNRNFKAVMAQDQEAFLNLTSARAFRDALEDQAFLNLLKSKNALAAMDTSEFANLMRSHRKFMDAFDNPNFANLAGNAKFLAALGESEGLMEALKFRGFHASLQNFEALQSRLKAAEQ